MAARRDNTPRVSEGVSRWLLTAGANAGLLLLVGLAAAAVLYLLKASASISVPLIVAVVVACISYPLMQIGDRLRLPRALSAAVVIVVIAALAWAAIQITVTGVIGQAPAIAKQLAIGVSDLAAFLNRQLTTIGLQPLSFDFSPDGLARAARQFMGGVKLGQVSGGANVANTVANGVGGVARALSGVGGVIFSCFIGFCSLYYLLTDFEHITVWVGDHIGQRRELGEGIIDDATRSLRSYFKSTTVTALVVDIAIGIGLWILGVPLVIPILIVTFLVAYIPFFGAIISSAFACLVALGHGGPVHALVVLLIVLVSHNLLQALVSNKLMGDSLNLHPLVVLTVTMLGSTFAGLLGAALAAPATAIVVCSYHRIKAHKAKQESEPVQP